MNEFKLDDLEFSKRVTEHLQWILLDLAKRVAQQAIEHSGAFADAKLPIPGGAVVESEIALELIDLAKTYSYKSKDKVSLAV